MRVVFPFCFSFKKNQRLPRLVCRDRRAHLGYFLAPLEKQILFRTFIFCLIKVSPHLAAAPAWYLCRFDCCSCRLPLLLVHRVECLFGAGGGGVSARRGVASSSSSSSRRGGGRPGRRLASAAPAPAPDFGGLGSLERTKNVSKTCQQQQQRQYLLLALLLLRPCDPLVSVAVEIVGLRRGGIEVGGGGRRSGRGGGGGGLAADLLDADFPGGRAVTGPGIFELLLFLYWGKEIQLSHLLFLGAGLGGSAGMVCGYADVWWWW